VTNDTPLSGSDSALVTVEVVGCQTFGCTLTQGYWKTHNSSFPGGAPPDSTWLVLPDSENTVFFLSGKTWFEVFWEPVSGNAYYNLAHQYMAAVLNTYNNASTPPQGIIDAIAAAEDLFNTYAPEDLFTTWTNGGGKEKQKKDMELHHAFTNLAGILGSFNEGTYDSEWPHCDEDFLSSLTLQDAKAGKTDAANADEVSAEAADAAGEDAAAKTDAAEEIPTEFNIGNYPNPFNPTTTILVELPEDATVTITVYDALGRRVTSLMNKELKAGYHRVVWDAGNLPSGQYFYSLQSEKFQRTKKMLLLK